MDGDSFGLVHHAPAEQCQHRPDPAQVFIGGATWSWIYLRWRNIYAAYVSHVFADLAVFGVGWWLVFGGASSS